MIIFSAKKFRANEIKKGRTDPIPEWVDKYDGCEIVAMELVGSDRGDGIPLMSCPQWNLDTKINLCDTCDYSMPTCPCEGEQGMQFGDGVGNDNVIHCMVHTVTKKDA